MDRRKFLKVLGVATTAAAVIPKVAQPHIELDDDEAMNRALFDAFNREWPENINRVIVDGRAYSVRDGEHIVKGKVVDRL